jgi:hypothetical protein
VIRACLALALCLFLAACGGGGGGTGVTAGGGGGTGGGTNPAATSPPAAPQVVSAGATAVDITVPGPSQTPPSNAQFLGTVPPGSTGTVSLFSTGDVVHQSTSPTVLISGPGISATSTVRISGPGDVTVQSQGGITDANNVTQPGIALKLSVAPNAVLGPRTVFITTGNDMTTFTGGLEVVQ